MDMAHAALNQPRNVLPRPSAVCDSFASTIRQLHAADMDDQEAAAKNPTAVTSLLTRRVSSEIIQLLNDVCFDWSTTMPDFDGGMQMLNKYIEIYGDAHVPRNYTSSCMPGIGRWLEAQVHAMAYSFNLRHAGSQASTALQPTHKSGKPVEVVQLTQEQETRLFQLGIAPPELHLSSCIEGQSESRCAPDG